MPTLPGQNGYENTMSNITPQRHHFRLTIFLLLLIVGLMVSCTPEAPTPTPTETSLPTQVIEVLSTPPQTPTPRPTSTPTLPPLGSVGNPITIGFIITPEESAAMEAAVDIALLIEADTGYAIESLFYPDFQSLSSAIFNSKVHLFWLGPFEYLFLQSEGAAQVVLVSNHLGVYAYGVQFMANTLRGFSSYFDEETNQSFGDPVEALQQFSGARPCLINPNSIPGYYVPIGLLANTSTPTLDPVFTYSYNAIIRALYIQGICDFGVSYALIGDPLTTSDISQNLPDAQDRIAVIWQSEGIIPNTNLSASPKLPVYIRHRLQEAFLDLSDNPEGLPLLSTALAYEIAALRTVEDSYYNPLRAAIMPLALDLETITHPPMNP
jgi:phosphonate transport system substrate-binding protein